MIKKLFYTLVLLSAINAYVSAMDPLQSIKKENAKPTDLTQQLDFTPDIPLVYEEKLQNLATGLLIQETLIEGIKSWAQAQQEFQQFLNMDARLILSIPGAKVLPNFGSSTIDIPLEAFKSSEAIGILLNNPQILLIAHEMKKQDYSLDNAYAKAEKYTNSTNPEVVIIGKLLRSALDTTQAKTNAVNHKLAFNKICTITGNYYPQFDFVNSAKLPKFTKNALATLHTILFEISKFFLEQNGIQATHKVQDEKFFRAMKRNEEILLKALLKIQENYTATHALYQEIYRDTFNELKKIKRGKNAKLTSTPQSKTGTTFLLPENLTELSFVTDDTKTTSTDSTVKKTKSGSKQKKANRKKKHQNQPAPELQSAQPTEAIKPTETVEPTIEIQPEPADLLYIKIEDARFPDVTHYLYKTSVTVPLNIDPQPQYTSTLQLWLSNPEEAANKLGYTDTQHPRFKYRDTAVWYHSFDQRIDDYIRHYGKQTTTKSLRDIDKQDILITMPGKMVTPHGEVPGLYTYIIDSKTGQWYHRLFEPRENKQLLQDYFAQGYYDVEFPPLGAKELY